MQKVNAAEILNKYKEGTCTPEEIQLLKKWFLTFEAEHVADFSESELKAAERKMWTAIEVHIPSTAYQAIPVEPRKLNSFPHFLRSNRWKSYAAAAVLVLVSIAAYFIIKPQPSSSINYVTLHTKDLMPGSDKAILVYANGRQRVLSGKVYKLTDGAKDVNQLAAEDNTIITPKGAQYQIVLSDGTAVWLNAASSLKYPVTFANKKQRKVILTGEAYFEVAHNKAQPFTVESANQSVEVLGTHFNINSYSNEEFTATTLMSGSVKVSSQNGFEIMKPGEQGLLSATNLKPTLIAVDTSLSVAWKNGFFQFKQADLKTVIRQLSRWYNVEVAYKGEVPEKIFTGKIYRDLKLSEALEVLSYFNVHFSLDGRTLTITN